MITSGLYLLMNKQSCYSLSCNLFEHPNAIPILARWGKMADDYNQIVICCCPYTCSKFLGLFFCCCCSVVLIVISKTNADFLQVILDEAIAKLEPNFFWLGGGEIDLKLGIRTSQFIDFVKPFIVKCSTQTLWKNERNHHSAYRR